MGTSRVELHRLGERFQFFARYEASTSPLYRRLAEHVTADDRLLSLAANARRGQQVPILFFAVVHYLVRCNRDDPLARYYSSVCADVRNDDPFPPFRSFCFDHEDEIRELLATRLVQTNEPRRAVALRLGLGVIASAAEGPFDLLELGASAGLNLCFDRYRIEVGGRALGPMASPVRLDCEPRSAIPETALIEPRLERRLGVDLEPLDVRSAQDREWLQALVWPEHRQRAVLLDSALRLVAEDPPSVERADAVADLRAVVERVADTKPLCLFHSALYAHIPQDRRERFVESVIAIGGERDLYWLSLEAPGVHQWPSVRDFEICHLLGVTTISKGQRVDRLLALVDIHGQWIECSTS
jgi:hypothetical protein